MMYVIRNKINRKLRMELAKQDMLKNIRKYLQIITMLFPSKSNNVCSICKLFTGIDKLIHVMNYKLDMPNQSNYFNEYFVLNESKFDKLIKSEIIHLNIYIV